MATAVHTAADRQRGGRHPLRRWLLSLDYTVLGLVVLLSIIGLVVMFSASAAVAAEHATSPWRFLFRQVSFMAVAALVMLIFSGLSSQTLKKISIPLFWGGIALLVATLFVGVTVSGARRWLDFGLVSLQPSELVKPALALFMGTLLCVKNTAEKRRRFYLSVAVMFVLVFLLYKQPHMSSIFLVSMVWLTQCLVAGVPFFLLCLPAGMGVMLFIFAYFTIPYVQSRFNRFLDPSQGDTYQIEQAREAMLSGGFSGLGLHEGQLKFRVPDAHTDFIFTVLIEEMGLIWGIFVLALYAWLVYHILQRLALRSERFEVIAGCGLVSILAYHVLVNIGVVTGVLPTTGMTLPLMSYGGSSLLATGVILGALLAILRKGNRYVGKP